MALKYVVKKRVFGFDKTKTEKYVAQNVITNTVNFRDLCKEVSMFGMIPEGPGNGRPGLLPQPAGGLHRHHHHPDVR